MCCRGHEELDMTEQLNWGHLALTGTVSIILYYKNYLLIDLSTCNAGDPGLIPGLGSSHGGGHGNPL